MKEEQKVYIKGSALRGDEIILFLEDLGGCNSNSLDGRNIDTYYFINLKGIISKISPDDAVIFDYIKEIYKEISIPRWKPKFKEYYYHISILGKVLRNYPWYGSDDDNLSYEFGNCFNTYDKAIAARDKIKEILHLHPRWKPQYKDYYYYIDETGNVIRDKWFDIQIDDSFFEFYNHFKTKEEALAARDKFKEILNK